jgi:hypothetical protein
MTTKEFRKRISESKLPNWFNAVSVTINYPHIDFEIELVGLSSIHDFFSKQVEGWQEPSSLTGEFQQSLNHFRQLIQLIEQFLENCVNLEDENSISNQWNNTRSQICSQNNYFTFDSEKSKFLIGLHLNHPEYYLGAYSYIIGQFRSSDKNDFIGSLLAYEFDSKGISELGKRVESERKSIKQLRNDFQNQINQTETQLTEHLTKSSKDYESYVTTIDKFKIEKEELFNSWYETTQNDFNIFDTDSKKKISELEKTYEEKLKLEKPAKYWQKKSTNYYAQGNRAKTLLFRIVGAACVLLAIILITSPDYIFNTVFDGNKVAIVRWSVVFITLLSLIAFAIRALSKYMFSSFHLARDAEERHTLTFFYLSLLKDTEVKDDDRKLILQSLFSRAETGLLKDESGPTMPSNDLTSKIFGNR